jgi:hypothetical protein
MSPRSTQLELIPRAEPGAVPIRLRSEGLCTVLEFYDRMHRSIDSNVKQRLGVAALQAFEKTFGVGELVESGMDEIEAKRMAEDFYLGENASGYNPANRSFLNSYIGRVNKDSRKDYKSELQKQKDNSAYDVSAGLSGEQPDNTKILPKRIELEPSQVILPRHSEVVQAATYSGISVEDKITLNRLVRLAGQDVSEGLPADELTAAIAAIKDGLYIAPTDERYYNAQQLIKLGIAQGIEKVGVVFPADEFPKVARSAHDLALHMQAKTRRANETNDDPADVAERTGRAGGHVLQDKIKTMGGLSLSLQTDQAFLRKMRAEVGRTWIAPYKFKNLERHRVRTDEMIHDTAEVAAINTNPGSAEIRALHDGIKKRLYGGNQSHSEIAQTWNAYITLVGKYIGMRLNRINISVKLCETELQYYQPYLDRKQEAA